ncbi:DUF1850 domain-containing protein [Halorubrum gandharaense]
MTRRSRAPTVVGVVAVLLVISGIAVFLAGGVDRVAGEPTLVVTDSDGNELVAAPIGENEEIILEYTHSVERTLVRDVYVHEDGRLVMTRMEFSSFGAGLPSDAEVVVRDGRYVYYPPRSEYETLRVMTGSTADHDLIIGGDRYDIAAMSDDGAVELTVVKRTRELL